MIDGTQRIVCPRCGSNNMPNQRACFKCGTPLPAMANPSAQPYTPPIYRPSPAVGPVAQPANGIKWGYVYAGIVIVGILLLVLSTGLAKRDTGRLTHSAQVSTSDFEESNSRIGLTHRARINVSDYGVWKQSLIDQYPGLIASITVRPELTISAGYTIQGGTETPSDDIPPGGITYSHAAINVTNTWNSISQDARGTFIRQAYDGFTRLRRPSGNYDYMIEIKQNGQFVLDYPEQQH